MWVFDNSKASLFNFLNRSIWENAFLFTICKEALDGAIREADLLRPVWEVLLDLVVLEFEDLEPVRERRLRSLSLGEEVDDFAAREGLFDVLILEEHDLIAILPNLSLDAIGEDDFLLSTGVELLFFTFGADDLVTLHKILVSFVRVILLWED